MDTSPANDGQGVSLLVYNPLAFPRQDVVEATVSLDAAGALQAIGPDGAPVPCQVVERDGSQVRLLFLADLPACGAAVYRIEATETPPALDTGLRVDTSGIENARYRVTVDERGRVTQIVDKAEGGRALLSAPIEYPFMREHPRIFPAWNMEWRDRQRAPLATLDGPAQIEVVEAGPVRVSLQNAAALTPPNPELTVRMTSPSNGCGWLATLPSPRASAVLKPDVAGVSFSWSARAHTATSMPPAGPTVWPMAPLIEKTGKRRSPKTVSIAVNSIASL